ncbi:hypothetical protein WME98_40385 [Sorangium sp. So ce296]|uniref:hypothetical protein n=1 Tax=Sorangium sp. So ce296 TaxID=3133296 RepID=UPI003F631177
MIAVAERGSAANINVLTMGGNVADDNGGGRERERRVESDIDATGKSKVRTVRVESGSSKIRAGDGSEVEGVTVGSGPASAELKSGGAKDSRVTLWVVPLVVAFIAALGAIVAALLQSGK